MSFKKVESQPDFPKLEEQVLKFWDENKIFEKSLDNRKDSQQFTFYDGPPFANGLPHYGHILAMTIKDTVTRFKTMEGFFVPRRGGWDTHGLPVEFETEKELGISGKPEIEKYGVKNFNQKAKESVFSYASEWEKTMARMGRWIDWTNAYTTMDRSYIESVWWVFKEIYKKGLIYQGYKSLPYCPRCGTPLSNFEVNQGYKDDVEDPSICIKFPLKDEAKTYFLVWTTTPWTLPGNTALAIGENINYVKISIGGEALILAEERLKVIQEKYEILKKIKIADLVGKKYKPLFDFSDQNKENKKIYEMVTADFVSIKDGTGIVHIAPAFGEDDLDLAQKDNISLVQTVDTNGNISSDKNLPGEGKFVKDADEEIIEDLKSRGLIYRSETIRHTYPFCWRCETPLLYYAMTTWFVKVSVIREKLTKNNQGIHWMPKYIKEGRFGKWLADARDWAVSRNRYWGAPIPIWQCQNCQKNIIVGSLKELSDLSKKDISQVDLHKPDIDEIEIDCDCGGKAKRVPEVLDCWFESGSMPYAEKHYPFENKENFKNSFPADFIAEGIDQTRGWFYTLHVLATILFDSPAYKNVVTNGIVLASDGKKLSKRLRNYDEPEVIFNGPGVDALRYFLLSSTPMGEDYRFSTEAVKMEVRKILLPLWNTLSFFVTYANVDGWKPTSDQEPRSKNILDQWIISLLKMKIIDMTQSMDQYDLTKASRTIEEFVTLLSQWYLKMSRKRRDDAFYNTLYWALRNFAIAIAPFMPFLAESIWQILKTDKDLLSVHLADWPKFEKEEVNLKLHNEMTKARHLVEEGWALRAADGIRLRQPLKSFSTNEKLSVETKELIKEALNVQEILSGTKLAELDTKITPELQEEGTMRDILRLVQDLRKKAGLNPEDLVDLYCVTSEDYQKIIEKFEAKIKKETNLENIVFQKNDVDFGKDFALKDQTLWLGVKK